MKWAICFRRFVVATLVLGEAPFKVIGNANIDVVSILAADGICKVHNVM